MTRSKRMYRIAEYVDSDQEAAAQELARLRSQVQAQEDQLERLREYCLSYHEQLAEVQARGGSAARLLSYSQFLARLSEAIAQQEQAVAAANRAFEQQRNVWIEARARVQAVTKAAGRLEQAENKTMERHEQRQNDDLSLNRLLKR